VFALASSLCLIAAAIRSKSHDTDMAGEPGKWSHQGKMISSIRGPQREGLDELGSK
jgi:hypothetical protein